MYQKLGLWLSLGLELNSLYGLSLAPKSNWAQLEGAQIPTKREPYRAQLVCQSIVMSLDARKLNKFGLTFVGYVKYINLFLFFFFFLLPLFKRSH